MVVIIIEKNFLLLFAPVRVEIRLESCLERDPSRSIRNAGLFSVLFHGRKIYFQAG